MWLKFVLLDYACGFVGCEIRAPGKLGVFAEVICGALEEGEVAGLNGEDFGTGG